MDISSTDNFLKHDMEIYRKSILVSPVPENPAVLQKLKDIAEKQVGILMYGTAEKLNQVSDFSNLYKLDVANGSRQLRQTIVALGYEINFNKKQENAKVPTMAIVRHNGAMIFSAYNANTTTDVQLHFPQGAPILCGTEAEMIDGYSVYHFGRSEHRECRVYVEQESGVISCREHAPVNMRYRRKILIRGLKDATVSLFSEKGCECAVCNDVEKDFAGPGHNAFFKDKKGKLKMTFHIQTYADAPSPNRKACICDAEIKNGTIEFELQE